MPTRQDTIRQVGKDITRRKLASPRPVYADGELVTVYQDRSTAEVVRQSGPLVLVAFVVALLAMQAFRG